MTVTSMLARTKTCPRCAEDIDEEALVCGYCGARFQVFRVGYCPHCRAVVPSTDGACSACGSELVDVHDVSAGIAEAPDVSSPPAESKPPVQEEGPVAAEPVPGRLRAGIAPSLVQRGALLLHRSAALGLVGFLVIQWTRTSPDWIFLATGVSGAMKHGARLGVAALIMPLICLAFATWQSRVRNAFSALVWATGIGVSLFALLDWKTGVENLTVQAGAYVAFALMGTGLLSTFGLLVSRPKRVQIAGEARTSPPGTAG